MRALRSICLAAGLLLAPAAFAQDTSEADRGFLTEFIEEKISGVGREVRIVGFDGALSSRATFDEMTIADAQGVWLTIRDGAIQWNRSALIRGRVEVGELSAAEIEVARLPTTETAGLPDVAAPAFRIPDLPVSIEIGTIRAERTILGAPLLGDEIVLSLDGTLSIADGEGSAKLAVERVDGTRGSLTLDAAFVNATETLTIDLALSEPEGGIAAKLLNLPGQPAMDLAIEGNGPLSDFTAQVALSSDGEDRLTGQIALRETPQPQADPTTAPLPPERSFLVDLSGDLAPLFLPEYRDFFGPDVRLVARGVRTSEGRTRLEEFKVEAAALTLDGTLVLAPDGLPEAFSFTGEIAAPDGSPVTLPMKAPPTRISQASLQLTFDAEKGDAWSGSIAMRDFERAGDKIGLVAIAAGGEIIRETTPGAGNALTARANIEARQIVLANPALDQAIGRKLDAVADVRWREGEPVQMTNLVAETETARLTATATLGAFAEGLPLTIKGSANLDDLSVFSALANRPLGGRLVLALNGTSTLLDARFDLRAGGAGRDLAVGIDILDGIIAGQSRLKIDARRDEAGITLREFEVLTDVSRIAAAGVVQAGKTYLTASARLEDVSIALPQLSGPANLSAEIRESSLGVYDVKATGEGPGQAILAFDGTLREAVDGALTAGGKLNAEIGSLAAYAKLAGQDIGGAVTLEATGNAALNDGDFDLTLALNGENLTTGQEILDNVLRGRARVTADVARAGEAITLREFRITTETARASATGQLLAGATRLDATAELIDTSLVVPGLSGPLAVTAEVSETAPQLYAVTASGTGPGSANARIDGSVRYDPEGERSAEGRLTARVTSLSPYSQLAGQSLGGSAALEASGMAVLGGDFNLDLDLSAQNLTTGDPTLNKLLRGTARLEADAQRVGEVTTIRTFRLTSPELTADLTGTLGRVEGRIVGDARLRNLAIFAPDFPGPLNATGVLSRGTDGSWATDITATGPGNTRVAIEGSAGPMGKVVDLDITGEAPVGLANATIAPRAVQGRASFDLAMRGPLALSSLSGRVTTSGARLVAPTYGIALGNIGGTLTLSDGRASVDLAGVVDSGGGLTVSGSLGLAAPNAADLRIGLANVVFVKPDLFKTDVSGAISVTGPLAGGGLVAGVLNLGETEVRIAATGLGTGDDIPGLRHLNDSRAVELTRIRAGIDEGGGYGASDGGGGDRRPMALDLVIRAPTRIFVRGRGLDAEFGGQLRLGGTTSDVVPQGQFDLIRGRLDILGRRLALDEGLVRLQGSFDPYIRIVATTEAEDITVRIALEGFVSDPEISISSQPELPEDEVLARLFFGKGLSELSPVQAIRLASAVAELAGRGGGGIVNRLRENFGLDDLDVTTDAEGNAAVRAGRYVSENVYTEVTVGSEGKADISINLDLSRSLTVKGSVDSDGDTSLGIFFERDY